MTERLEAVGGALKIRSAPGGGTRLKMTVPAASAEHTVQLAG
jgi:signal transduction histidine kinase